MASAFKKISLDAPKEEVLNILREDAGAIIKGMLTTDPYRRAGAFTFNLGWLAPEEAYPFVVDMALVRTLSPRVQQILGFRSFTADLYGLPGLWQVNYEEIADYIGLNTPT